MPLPLLALGGIAAGYLLLGSLGNFFPNKSATDREEMLQDKAFQEWMKIAIPDTCERQKLASRSL